MDCVGPWPWDRDLMECVGPCPWDRDLMECVGPRSVGTVGHNSPIHLWTLPNPMGCHNGLEARLRENGTFYKRKVAITAFFFRRFTGFFFRMHVAIIRLNENSAMIDD